MFIGILRRRKQGEHRQWPKNLLHGKSALFFLCCIHIDIYSPSLSRWSFSDIGQRPRSFWNIQLWRWWNRPELSNHYQSRFSSTGVSNVFTFWPCCFVTMSFPYKIILAREQNNLHYTPKLLMISILTKCSIYHIKWVPSCNRLFFPCGNFPHHCSCRSFWNIQLRSKTMK